MKFKLIAPFAVARIVLLALTLFASYLKTSAQEGRYHVSGTDVTLWYSINENSASVTITRGTGRGDIIVPETIEGYPVTDIADFAFDFGRGFTSLTVGDNLTSIGASAFYKSGLTHVTVGAGLAFVGNKAFSGCNGLIVFVVDPDNPSYTSLDGLLYNKSLTKLVAYPTGRDGAFIIPSSVTEVGEAAFWGCGGLSDITLPDNLTTIGSEAFSFTGMSNVNIPASVTSIGPGAFIGGPNLTSFTVDLSNSSYATVDGVLYDATLTELVDFPASRSGSFVIPNGVTTIAAYAFSWSRFITDITIPDSATTIGEGAFRLSGSLASVTIGANVTTIGGAAFENCGSLIEIVIPDSVITIGDSAFYRCPNLTTATIGSSVSSIGASAFRDCQKLTGVLIPSSVEMIGDLAFYQCRALSTITIPDSVLTIGESAFYGCSGLSSVFLGNSLSSIGATAFWECSELMEITIPASVTTIGERAFANCASLESISVESENANYAGIAGVLYDKAVTELLAYPTARIGAFSIPSTVITIGDSAFYKCAGLSAVTIPVGVLTISDSAFYGCSGLTSLVIPDSVSAVGDAAFYDCSKLTSLTIGNSVNTIGDEAFNACSSLTSLTIPDSVLSIGAYAFSKCFGLTGITIGSGVATIGEAAFIRCQSLTDYVVDAGNPNFTSVQGVLYDAALTQLVAYPAGRSQSYIIPDGVSSIGAYAFYYCSGLSAITIPDSVLTIGDSAFYRCYGLTGLIIPDSVTTIGDSAFYFSYNLTSLTIGNGVHTIGDYAFYYCSDLTEVLIPASVTSIGDLAFYRCTGLTQATFIGDAPEVFGSFVFYYTASSFAVYFYEGAVGFTTPTWKEYSAVVIGPPLADAGPDQVLRGDPSIGYETVFLDGSASFDANGSIVQWEWSWEEGGALFASGVTFSANFPIGSTQVTLTVTDNDGRTGTDTVEIFVVDVPSYLSFNVSGDTVTITDCETTYEGAVVIPATIAEKPVTEIARSAFRNCDGVTSIAIPGSVTSVGSYAFSGCSVLTDFLVAPENTNFASLEGVLYNKSLTELLVCPEGQQGAFVIPPSVTLIGERAFNDCTSLTSVTIGTSVTRIGFFAFMGCNSLTDITIPASITAIGVRAFASCRELEDIYVDSGNPTYASVDGVLYDKSLTELIAFPGGRSGEFLISNNVLSITDYAFYNCDNLTSVEISDGLNSIGRYAFYDCDSLTRVVLSNNISSIEERAFYSSSALKAAVFRGDAPGTLESYVFNGVSSDFTVYFYSGASGFTTPAWEGYSSEMLFPPTADAGPDQNALEADASGFGFVVLDGSGSSVGDGHNEPILEWTWEDGGPESVSGERVNANLPIGTTLVSLTVTDHYGVTDADTVLIIVETDSDSDGFSDSLEALLGTDPNNANDTFKAWLTTGEGGLPQLQYGPHSANCEFTVEWTDDLGDPESWQVVDGLSFTGDSSEQSADLPETGTDAAFYRIQVSGSQD